jgi:hypothetical protein
MPKPTDLCTCGHLNTQHRGKGGACITRGYKGINTEETGEKGKAGIADLGTVCPCEKFTPDKSRGVLRASQKRK